MWILIGFVLLLQVHERLAETPRQYAVLPRDSTDLIPRVPLNVNDSYCFQFTWMGRNYDNQTFIQIANKTCNDFFSLLKEKPLCVDPMVATDNGKEPDIDATFQDPDLGNKVLCKLREDQVCAKYTWYYNGVLANVSRYCTRINVDMESSMQSGCVDEKRGPYTVQVCACRSDKGGDPCNAGTTLQPTYVAFCITSLILVYQYLLSKPNSEHL